MGRPLRAQEAWMGRPCLSRHEFTHPAPMACCSRKASGRSN